MQSRFLIVAIAAMSVVTAAPRGSVAPQRPPAAPAAAPAKPAPQDSPPPAPAAGGSHTLDGDDLHAWLDGFLPYALKSGDIAGAVIAVVKDGQVVLEQGYGYSDVAKKTPMDARQTLVRPGSTSKLFTWTAVMQLVQQGKIDLNRD